MANTALPTPFPMAGLLQMGPKSEGSDFGKCPPPAHLNCLPAEEKVERECAIREEGGRRATEMRNRLATTSFVRLGTLNELNERPKLDPMALICSAESWSVLGEKDKAFQFLEAAYQDRVSLLIYLDVRPTFNNIRL